MDCETFKQNLYTYIEEDTGLALQVEMKMHMDKCEICRSAYFERKKLLENTKNKLSTRKHPIKKSVFTYIYICLALFTFMILSNLYNINNITQFFTSMPSKESKVNLFQNSNMLFSISPKVGEERRKELLTLTASLNDKKADVGMWRIIYSNYRRTILYNNSHMLVYNNEEGNLGVYGALDLKKLDIAFYKESSVSAFKPSPNGALCIIGNIDGTMDGEKKSLYIFDVEKNSKQIIAKGNMINLKTAWSPSSRYFVYGDVNGKKVGIYDALSNKVHDIKYDKGEIKNLFVSDKGDVIVESNRKYIFYKTDYGNNIELKLYGEILQFNDGYIFYYKEGLVYKYDMKSSELTKNIGKGFKLDQTSIYGSSFTDGNSLKVYNYEDSDIFIYSVFGNEQNKMFSQDFKKYIAVDDHNLKVVDCVGKIHKIPTNGSFEVNWLDYNRILIVTQEYKGEENEGIIIKNYDLKKNHEQVMFKP